LYFSTCPGKLSSTIMYIVFNYHHESSLQTWFLPCRRHFTRCFICINSSNLCSYFELSVINIITFKIEGKKLKSMGFWEVQPCTGDKLGHGRLQNFESKYNLDSKRLWDVLSIY
jgi:hypothetical protein